MSDELDEEMDACMWAAIKKFVMQTIAAIVFLWVIGFAVLESYR